MTEEAPRWDILEALSDPVLVTDRTGQVVAINNAMTESLGYTAEDIVGRRPSMLKSGLTQPKVYRDLWATILAGKVWRGDLLNRTKDGRTVWHRLSISPLRDAKGAITHFVSVRQNADSTRQAEEQFRLISQVFQHATEAVFVTDHQARILMVNRAFSLVTGYTEEEVLGKTPAVLSSGRHDKDFYRTMWRAMTEEGHWEGEIWNRRKGGELFAEWLSIVADRDQDGNIRHFIALMRDITDIKVQEAKLQWHAGHDQLTALPNRTMFMGRLETALEAAQRQNNAVGLLFVDIDHFGTVNDTLGHTVGDEIICEASARIGAVTRHSDLVSRWGGDEFAVLLQNIRGTKDASTIAVAIVNALRQPFHIMDHELHMGASVGLSVFPEDAADAEALVRNADLAMHQAQRNGRGRLHVYSADMRERATKRLTLEQELRQALDQLDQQPRLYPAYQPIMALRDRVLVGFESLMRWRREDGTMVPPDQFIRVAEETGLIERLGLYSLVQSCHALKNLSHAARRPLSMAVNVSSMQVQRGLTAKTISDIISASGITPRQLVLELTETTLLEDGPAVHSWIESVRALGVRLSLDDFGTGYSSLSYLRRFRMDRVKIDRSFIADIATSNDDAALVRAAVQMAHGLGIEAVGEGVETEAQHAQLIQIGCDFGQGWLYAPALPEDDALDFVASKHAPLDKQAAK